MTHAVSRPGGVTLTSYAPGVPSAVLRSLAGTRPIPAIAPVWRWIRAVWATLNPCESARRRSWYRRHFGHEIISYAVVRGQVRSICTECMEDTWL